MCGKEYKTGGGTTNLRNHILRKHPFAKSNKKNESAKSNADKSLLSTPAKRTKADSDSESDVICEEMLEIESHELSDTSGDFTSDFTCNTTDNKVFLFVQIFRCTKLSVHYCQLFCYLRYKVG